MKDYMLLLPILFPAIAALLTLVIKNKFSERGFRNIYVGVVLVLTFIFNLYAISNYNGLTLFYLTRKLPVMFRVDKLTYLFNILVTTMWLLAGIFSFEYMKHEDRNESFYMFYLLTESVLLGLGMAGNFLTFYLFYEFMTFLSLPLALHTRTKEAIEGGL